MIAKIDNTLSTARLDDVAAKKPRSVPLENPTAALRTAS